MFKNIVIGGPKYKWKGRSLKNTRKDGDVGVILCAKDSIVMAQCDIASCAKYDVTIIGSKITGSGDICINFFGGKTADGTVKTLAINGNKSSKYTAKLSSPAFDDHIKPYIRIWRPAGATGSVFIKAILLSWVEGGEQRTAITTKQMKDRVVKNKIIKEDDPMRFRPYDLSKRVTDDVKKVLINKAEDVPKVSIITPSRDGLDLLKKCYTALDAYTSYPNWEWVVGDSASSDGTEEFFNTLGDSRVKFVQRGTKEGSFSSINNELVLKASGEYVLFLNNDTEPQPFWLYEMMAKIHNDESIGVVGSRLLYPNKTIQHAGIAFVAQGPANIGHSVLSHFPKNYHVRDRYYQAVTGACMLMRLEDFNTVGGFDERYYFCYEDVDLCLKIKHELNKKILYAANSIVIHSESITQNKYKTAGQKQKEGIAFFKDKWMKKIEIDFSSYQKNANKGVAKTDVSFVTCVNDIKQYKNLVVGSLFKNTTNKAYEIIPVLNFDNEYSAAQALNIGLDKARADVVVFCHQDVLFYENWITTLFKRIEEIEKKQKPWGVLGTAGINTRDDTVGVVHSMKGTMQWQSTTRATIFPVQTVDEHCMIVKKSSGLRFDDKLLDGFHFYGPDICLNALKRGFENYGILCPLVHHSASGSLSSGKKEFMRLLNVIISKWRPSFPLIRTTTAFIRKRSHQVFVRF